MQNEMKLKLFYNENDFFHRKIKNENSNVEIAVNYFFGEIRFQVRPNIRRKL